MYAGLMQKRCTKCKEVKSVDEFTKNRSNKDGMDQYCRPCKSILKQLDYKKHQESIKIKRRLSYKKDKAKIIARVRRYRLANKDLIVAKKRLESTGVTSEQYNGMYKKQHGRCAICQRHETQFKIKLSADHCHDTKRFRGLLCGACNTAIGLFKEDISLMLKAKAYLLKHQK